jgi:DNA-binding protein HU-beta
MTKAELIAKIAEQTKLSKVDACKALDAITAAIGASLAAGEKVTLTGFGTFDVAARAERKGRNPRTGQEIKIAASKTPKFKAGQTLKDSLK